jgi:LDH2 family malate/lactate/ureidoglycolate dehydrogenase
MERLLEEGSLRSLEEAILKAEGFTQEDAAGIADVLMLSDLYGIESHGAQRLFFYHQNLREGRIQVHAEPEVIRSTPVSALMDGHFAMGHLVGIRAMEEAIRRAQTAGVGIVAVRNSTHFGIAGYYTKMAADRGLAAFSMTNSAPFALPTFGAEKMMGTNPFSFSMPADPFPFWFDASTTVVTLGKVEVYNKREKEMPRGWVLDGQGRDLQEAGDANRILLSPGDGGLLPLGGPGEMLGGHKGYGLSVMVELLTGILSCGETAPELAGDKEGHACHFFLAFDPSLFGDPSGIRERASAYLQALRDSRKQPGHERIFTAGEKAARTCQRRLREGIPVDGKTWTEIRTICTELGVDHPALTGEEENHDL